jgi:hypothetical protein
MTNELEVFQELLKRYGLKFSTGGGSGDIVYDFATLSDGAIKLVSAYGPFDIEVDADAIPDPVKEAVGKDYSLITPADLDESDPCTPCCKKSNLSRSIWAYINPRTMTPYDDDYWFH